MAIVLVEQYFDFACELADRYAVMDRGRIVLSGAAGGGRRGRSAALDDGVTPGAPIFVHVRR